MHRSTASQAPASIVQRSRNFDDRITGQNSNTLRLGQAVIVQIDEYLTSQVHSYFLFFCCCEHVIDAFLLFCTDLQQLPKTGIEKMGRSRRKRVPWHFRMQKLSYALEPRVNAAKNMYWIAESIWAGHGRPACFQRPSSNITAANAGSTEVG